MTKTKKPTTAPKPTRDGATTAAPKRTCLLVLGMHRSGTSMLARVLSIAGAALPANLMGASPGNDAGHWESNRLMEYQNSLLKRMGSSWHDWRALEKSKLSVAQQKEAKEEIRNILSDEFDEAPLYLVKDPRICRFAPMFLDALEEVGETVHVVMPVRNPLEVCESLAARTEAWSSDRTKGDAALLWLRHVLDAEAATRKRKRAILTYSDLMDDWRTAIDTLTTRFDISWPYPIDDIAPDIETFIKQGRRHHSYSTEDVLLDSVLRGWVGETWQAILVLSRNPQSKAALGKLDEVRRSFNAAAPILHQRHEEARSKWQSEISEVQGELKTEKLQAETLAAELVEKTDIILKKEASEASLQQQLADRDTRITELDAKGKDQKSVIATQSKSIRELTRQAAHLERQMNALNTNLRSQTGVLKTKIVQKDRELRRFSESLAKKNKDVLEQEAALSAIQASTSWQITAPLRKAARFTRSKNEDQPGETSGWGPSSLKAYLIYRLKHKRRDAAQLTKVARSSAFDAAWYLKEHPDVAAAGLDPLLHYFEHGSQEGRAPCADFDAEFYVSANDDVAGDELDPFVHYALYGKTEGRDGRQPKISKHPHIASEYVPIIDHEKQRDRLKKYLAYKATRTAKTVIYTANVGDYDDLYIPEFLDLETDYICFTDTAKDTHGVWELRPLPWIDSDTTRSARFAKLNPHYLLPEYELSIWIDGNVLLRCSTKEITERLSADEVFATFQHPFRDCVFDEVDACIEGDRDDTNLLAQQKQRYRDKSLPKNFGLYETNVLVRRHNEPSCVTFMNAWWEELNKYSKRDQISLSYVIHKLKSQPSLILPEGQCSRNHPWFALFQHSQENGYIPPTFLEEFSTLSDPWRLEPFTRDKFIQPALSVSIDIIICVHNALDDVTACLSSVARHINPAMHRIIIVDDGSDAPTQTYLEEFAAGSPGATLIRNDVAQRYTKAANIGVKASTADWVIMLNSDTIVTEAWAEKLVATGLLSPHNGLVGPLSNAASFQSIPSIKGENGQTAVNQIPPGKTVDDLANFCEQISYSSYAPCTPLLHGCCLAISRNVIDKIGLFDEVNFPKGFGEENDYCFRAMDAGFKLVVATNTYIFHAKTKSYTPATRLKLQESSGNAFTEKHGLARVRRAVLAFEHHSMLAGIRQQAEQYYLKHSSQLGSQLTNADTPKAKLVNINKNSPLNVAVLCPQSPVGPNSSTFIRLQLPLTSRSVRDSVNLNIVPRGEYDIAADVDVCIVQRTVLTEMTRAKQLLNRLSNSHTRLIVENDDAFSLLDDNHPEKAKYQSWSPVMEHLMGEARHVFVSSEPLRTLYKGASGSVSVIPNSLDVRVWKQDLLPHRLIGEDSTIKMVFMGTKTHDADFHMILPALEQLAKKYPNLFTVTIIGGLHKGTPNYPWLKTLNVGRENTVYPNFANWLMRQGPFDIGLAPLVDTPFNRCKSDIKFLDYCGMKVLPILSDITPYQSDPMVRDLAVLVENTVEKWYSALEQACLDIKQYRPMVALGSSHLWTHRNSDLTGQKLLKLI